MAKFLPLVGVLVFGIFVIKLMVLFGAPWMNRDASGLDVVMIIGLFVGMCAMLSFALSKTSLFKEDKETH